jgi:hypothetical protein
MLYAARSVTAATGGLIGTDILLYGWLTRPLAHWALLLGIGMMVARYFYRRSAGLPAWLPRGGVDRDMEWFEAAATDDANLVAAAALSLLYFASLLIG